MQKVKKIRLLILFLAITLLSMPFLPIEGAAKEASKTQTLEGKLNINTATAKQLTMLPGIGKKTAQAIIDYRTQNGDFKTTKDLMQVKGVGKKTIEKIEDLVIMEGKSTLAKM
jgi:competence protein ComEA